MEMLIGILPTVRDTDSGVAALVWGLGLEDCSCWSTWQCHRDTSDGVVGVG